MALNSILNEREPYEIRYIDTRACTHESYIRRIARRYIIFGQLVQEIISQNIENSFGNALSAFDKFLHSNILVTNLSF
jgi:hypothetical protein